LFQVYILDALICLAAQSSVIDVGAGFTFSSLKKISVGTGNGIPAEISRFSGDFDWKEFSNSKFRNFGFPAGISLYFTGIPVHFTEK